MFSVYPFPLWWLREYTLIIIMKSEVWTIIDYASGGVLNFGLKVRSSLMLQGKMCQSVAIGILHLLQ